MKANEKLIMYENAYADYTLGKTYKEIAEKYNVSINTVKSWKKRLNWTRNYTSVAGANVQGAKTLGNNFTGEEIKQDLLKQLESNGTYGKHYEDIISDYMSLWSIKNNLIADIRERGVAVEWSNGKQFSIKKNESISELNKTSAQMLKILSELGLKPLPASGNDVYEI